MTNLPKPPIEGQQNSLSAEEIKAKVVQELNQYLAIVHTKSTYILFEKAPTDFVLDSKVSMRAYFNTDLVEIEGKLIKKFDVWFNNPKRRVFKNIIFDPRIPGHQNGEYNLWKGFAYQPIQGDCSLFLEHMRNVICGESEKHYEYLLNWCAYLVQKPWEIGTSVLLRGLQGTGKGVFVHGLGTLFGHHYAQLASLDQILGRFNSHLQHSILVLADEAIWGGNKKEVGALKALITEKRQFIEAKGKDGYWIENHKHLIVSSNEDFVVHLDADDRRFFVLDVSSQRKEDIAYFKAIENQLKSGGYEALLYELMSRDISCFDPRIMPDNFAGFDIKMMSATSIERFLYSALKDGCWDIALAEPSYRFATDILSDRFYTLYGNWCDWTHEKTLGREIVGIRIRKIFPSTLKKKSSREENPKRPPFYIFLSFEECRRDFERFFKQNDSIWDL